MEEISKNIYFRSCAVVPPTSIYTIHPLNGSRVNKP
jgi:hypothetical protein